MEINGKRNLTVLGIMAIAVAGLTTGLSLWVYRSSGDIYLDRSRPGYLPDKEEVGDESNQPDSSYVFGETGEITQNELDEYLKQLKIINDRIKALADPYAPGPLSNESLGIPAAKDEAKKKD